MVSNSFISIPQALICYFGGFFSTHILNMERRLPSRRHRTMEPNRDINTNEVEDPEAKRRQQNRERQRRRRQRLAMQQTMNVAEPSTPEVNAPVPEHTNFAIAQ